MVSKLGYKFGAATGRLRSPNALGGSGPQAKSCLWTVLRAWGVVLVLASLAVAVGGCNGWFRPVGWSELGPPSDPRPKSPFAVIPRNGREAATLSPDDIVRVMQRVGFADEQVMELGTSLHSALALSGYAEITYHKEKLAIFMVEGDYLRIQSRSGRFDYQLSAGQFVSSSQGGY